MASTMAARMSETSRPGESSGSVTAAGAASLVFCTSRLIRRGLISSQSVKTITPLPRLPRLLRQRLNSVSILSPPMFPH